MNQRHDQMLVSALARGESIVRAARLSGISERTVHRRLKEPEFQAQINSTRSLLVENASSGIACAMSEAVLTLRHLLTAQSESVRLSASRVILETGMKLREHADFEKRLEILEERQNEIDDQAAEAQHQAGTTGISFGRGDSTTPSRTSGD